MPDQYGNPTEAELRGQSPGGSAPLSQPATQPKTTYEGRYGTLYGEGPQLNDEQALAYIQNINRDAWARGALPVEQWQKYHPNATPEELKAYKRLVKTYQQNTSGTGGVGNSLGNAASFELDHVGNILEGLTDPTRIFGIDPLTTKFGNAVFGTNNDPLVNQMGGATSQQIKDYESRHGLNSAGGAQGLHNAAAGTAAVIAAGTLANGGLTGGQGGGAPTQLYQGGYNGNFATQTVGMPAAEAGAAGGGASAAGAGLPEIVVSASAPTGLSAGEIAAIGSGVAGAGGAAAASGGGSSAGSGNYGDYGGLNTADTSGGLSMGNASEYGAANNGLVLEGGAGTTGGGLSGYAQQAADYYDKYGGALQSVGSSTKSSPKGSSYTYRDPWYADAGQAALERATALSNRPYEGYGGERVAGLSGNEEQAYRIAGDYASRYSPFVQRLSGGYNSAALAPYQDPYLDSVLSSRLKSIDQNYGSQLAALDRNAAATDAFRSGRSDLARARLGASRMKAADTATNEAKSEAFKNAQNAYFQQGSQDIGALGALNSTLNSEVGALSSTGQAERGVRQARDDFNYGQFLERRDWDVNNLDNLLKAIGAVNPTAGSTTKGKNAKPDTDWGQVAGMLGTALASYYGQGG